ncbi:hypothetical protein DFQ14_103276 [Halopolyspora algeriensis]|uniref:Uncharacterized protein n=1 Tax=Halopolyspora algeriensis TaxID=1500506 RepID=A0A368VYJ1_9ACTN|nr:hypothetical protein [Halopolyspora algeriensis]RCW45307.1 hypothetical protein DFQ14_103276 [Halopolyspora algeriensis]TQM47347.1 hypothetical protein FHU43_3332 [Halopolyspora algeriensis]
MTSDQDNSDFARGPNTLCFICGGYRRIGEARLYAVQATSDLQTGMTMAEWRTCPHCEGTGQLRGLRAPV